MVHQSLFGAVVDYVGDGAVERGVSRTNLFIV